MKLNTIEDINRFLDEMPAFQHVGTEAARFDLEGFRKFCHAMGEPQGHYPAIHIAGTNGKGSTCQILGAMFHEAGLKTGLYTSPHLIEYRERFQVDGRYISNADLQEFFKEHEGLVKSYRLSYFELSTAIAFWWFDRQEVDVAIIEVGLGGRLDATNVIDPLVSMITNISLDHTDILGDTIEDIAREKAGIIKPGTPVVLGNVKAEAVEIIKNIAAPLNSKVYESQKLEPRLEEGKCYLSVDGQVLSFSTDLVHPVQAHNIAAAWQLILVVQEHFTLSEEKLRNGLRKVKSVFKNPGRFEKLDPDYDWYFDGAHNTEAVKAMTSAVKGLKPLNQVVLILSLMKDKITPSVIEEFQKFKKIYYYNTNSKRSADIGMIKKWLPEANAISEDKRQQMLFLKELESELVIFAGSFYFYATVRKWLQTLHSDH